MLQNVNLDEVKQYNATLKQYKDKAATLNAEIEYTNKELDALCVELSAELGKQVTRDNVMQIYQEQVESIQSTLQSGNAILAKIASEEQKMSQVHVAQPTMAQPQPVQSVQMGQPTMGQPMAQPQPMVQQQPVMQTQPINSAPVQGSVFNGQAATLPGQQPQGTLPPLFSLS